VRTTFLAAALLAAMGCASVRTVDDGALYRSGQLSGKQLEHVIRTHGIKTVVNLRGIQPDRSWYRQEQEVCRRNDVEMIDVALDSGAPERGEIAALLDAYHHAPRPILVHSWSSQGSVGLASGLYRAVVREEPPDQARRELAWWQSSRWPMRYLPGSMSIHDRFLAEWQGERDFFATYQLAGRDELPELSDRSFASLKPSPPPQFGGPQQGSDLTLPPPSMDLFSGGREDRRSLSWREAPSTSPGAHRPVAWFGRPVEIPNMP